MVNFVFLSVYFYSVPNLRFTNNQLKDFKIVDICKLKQGNQYDLKQQFTEEKSDLKRFIRIVDYTQKTNDIRYVYSNGSENYVDCTDVVVVRYGASAGYVGRGINGIIANNLFTIRPINSALLNKSYLYHYLNAPVIQKQLNNTQSSGMPALNFQTINNLHILLPKYQEQRQIAVFLDKIDERIQTQIKIIELKQSLIKDIEDKILWKTTNTHAKPIREFLTEINDKSIIQNQYPLLSSTKKGLFLQTEYFNKEAASSNNIGYKIVHKGEIIISPQNLWMGNITFNDKFDNGLVSPSYRIYKVKEQYNTFYISRILMSYRALSLYKNISEQGASIVRRNLNVDAFNELCFPIPNIKKQDEVSLFLSKLHQELNYETWILMQLKSQKNYLLNNMFI